MTKLSEKYIGEALLKDEAKKKLALVIKDNAVTTDKIADKAVTKDKVADDAIYINQLSPELRKALYLYLQESVADTLLDKHIKDTGNPHNVTKEQLGYATEKFIIDKPSTKRPLVINRRGVAYKIRINDGFGGASVASFLIPYAGLYNNRKIWRDIDDNAIVPDAGLMLYEDKEKLDSITIKDGIISSDNLPSYIDDVIEGYLCDGNFYKEKEVKQSDKTYDLTTTEKTIAGGTLVEYGYTGVITPETGKIYVDLNNTSANNKIYRYTGESYVIISDIDQETLKQVNTNTDNIESLQTTVDNELVAITDDEIKNYAKTLD